VAVEFLTDAQVAPYGRFDGVPSRALTRIATPATEADLAELAAPMTAGQLERFVRAHRQVARADDTSARTARRVIWRLEEDGSLAMTSACPLSALRAAVNDLDPPHP
jgi:hypothetical protein